MLSLLPDPSESTAGDNNAFSGSSEPLGATLGAHGVWQVRRPAWSRERDSHHPQGKRHLSCPAPCSRLMCCSNCC